VAKVRRASGSRKKPRSWLWLIAGLVVGAAVMYGVQRYVYKDGKPFASLARVLDPERNRMDRQEVRPAPPTVDRPSKPKLDFYTILPGETLLPEPKPDKDRKTAKAEPAERGVSYMLQAAAYAHLEDADRLKAKLALNGLEAHIEKITVGDKGTHYRVRLGPYSSIEALDSANSKLAQLGIKAMRLRVQKPPRT
jgi:cell division protein FtsN